MQEIAVQEFEENRTYLENIDFFKQFDDEQKDKLAGVLSN